MWKGFSETIQGSWIARFILSVFIVLSLWWVTIYWRDLTSGFENNAFTLIYPWISLIGGVVGLLISNKWGGLKSIIGRSLFVLSLGLLAQTFGQAAYAYYIYVLGIEVPYPSMGDVGYFGSVIFYLYGVLLLARVLRVNFSLRSLVGQAQAIIIPLILLGLSYILFLRGYEFDWSQPLKVFLDLGYPFGQAIYVSIATIAFLASRKALGGMMREPMSFLLVALIVQYFSDFIFLYEASNEQWYVGGVNDYMYFVSYCLMAIGLIQLGVTFKKIDES
ncbi:MAG: hypothetical protein A3E37_02815 [Candidatus Andersenbacteria bacterium RIFCSPHIGHO2_12_FULL_46_9]|nr:MAG: hypothetical protein UW94_C0007G0028 [Parcubacteria group bacterium GW2011_GWA2_45_14]OGY33025.1 MAG: hypothetical protein A3B76_01270 [Candidatus Andersenbacteria bacterium RIFCSPHIGHO2_02_FULL_46_16]OGY36531.1 MAG: hypothetical protein A3E37_02815 [Candidatus Andersenbacteria bacterium RIFCSPHIGHO2_12_FULL_46_9]OGY37134.1 MAG: hypothetical protein A3I08_02110 [Candidatus Andersenbacteria bacterium RIFCSPLOWO2_02_FULL_46_11]OGY39498.1 MAG: hypothetical protein A3G57_04255 [Candidatus A